MRRGQDQDKGDLSWPDWWGERGERELKCILMTAWDPIGVGDTAEAWDEYESYASEVARILRETHDSQEAAGQISGYLTGVERDSMELHDQSPLDNARLAAALVAWHDWSFVRGGAP